MRILVIGSGGREHAIIRALSLDPAVTELHAAPGNPGISELAKLHEVKPNDPGDVRAMNFYTMQKDPRAAVGPSAFCVTSR